MLSVLNGQKFRQKINLIELTKILEREPCDSLSFTHKLRTNYLPYASYINYSTIAWESDRITGEKIRDLPTNTFSFHSNELSYFYISPELKDTFYVKFIPVYFIGEFNPEIYLKVKAPTGSDLLVAKIVGTSGRESYTNGGYVYPEFASDFGSKCYIYGTNPAEEAYFDTSMNGIYTFQYTYSAETSGTSIYNLVLTFYIELKEATPTKPIPSITDVINRLLSVGEPRPVYIHPKYTLDPDIASLFSETPSPEFFFPRMTLFEGLLEVGKKIHAIPRLTMSGTAGSDDTGRRTNVVTFDLLGLDQTYKLPNDAKVIGYKNKQSIDDYCGALDSYVENHINTVDPNAGTITEPFDGGFKTLRCESGVQITNKTAVFEATRPIYRVVKFEMAYTSGSPETVIGDITKYLFEQAEYEGLFASDAATYPNSISHALVWRQGDRFIRGFNTTSASLLNLVQNFQKESIQNIVEDEGKVFGTNVYGNLAFRLTYIPMDNIRLRQYKPYDTHPDANVIYNQQNANTVEGSYYGENLKGKIARMGNTTEVYTVRYPAPIHYEGIFQTPKNVLPKIGNILVDSDNTPQGYIYKVVKKADRDFTVCDVYVTQDFNRLASYFSLESNFRLFEVSERQSIDRQIIIPRIIHISLGYGDYDYLHAMSNKATPGGSSSGTLRRFMAMFTPTQSLSGIEKRATVAVVRLLADEANNYAQIGEKCYTFPVNSTACGNSLAFSFRFDDSFSAGKRSAEGGVDNGIQWKQQKNSPYGDAYGEFYAMEFGIAQTLYEEDNGSYIPKTLTWADQSTAGGFEDSLPLIDTETYKATMNSAYFSTNTLLPGGSTSPVSDITQNTSIRVIDKNSSERVSFTLQFHGRATDKKIVMGPALWNNNLLIRDEPVKDDNGNVRVPHVYGLKSGMLNMLRTTIDLSSAMIVDCTQNGSAVISTSASSTSGDIDRMTLSSAVDFVAWCIADSVTGEIYIGVNEEVKKGDKTSLINFEFDEEA